MLMLRKKHLYRLVVCMLSCVLLFGSIAPVLQLQAGNAMPITQAGSQRIYSITEVADAVLAGSTMLTVITGTATENVWVHHSGERWTQGTRIQESNTQRVWQITFTPLQAISQNVSVYANRGFYLHGATSRVHRITLGASTPQSTQQNVNHASLQELPQFMHPNPGTYPTNGLIAGLVKEYFMEMSRNYRNFTTRDVVITPQMQQRHQRLLQDIVNAWEDDPATRAFGINRAGIEALLSQADIMISEKIVTFARFSFYQDGNYVMAQTVQEGEGGVASSLIIWFDQPQRPSSNCSACLLNSTSKGINFSLSMYAWASTYDSTDWFNFMMRNYIVNYLSMLFGMIGFTGAPLIECHHANPLFYVEDSGYGFSIARIMAFHLVYDKLYPSNFDMITRVANAKGLHILMAAVWQGEEYFSNWMTQQMQYIYPKLNFSFEELRLAESGIALYYHWRFEDDPRARRSWHISRFAWWDFFDAVADNLPLHEQSQAAQILNEIIAMYRTLAINNNLPPVPFTNNLSFHVSMN